jgi:hypothetical protein
MEGRWAYRIGILAPAALAGDGLCHRYAWRGGSPAFPRQRGSLIRGVTAILSCFVVAACGRRRFREYAGLGKSLNTFAVSFVIVAVCYTHPRYLVLAPHPDFGGWELSSEQPPALPPSADPEASFGPSKAGIPLGRR